jgi:phosphonoacetate hydrolase
MTQDVELNGVTYHWPTKPVVVICIDGGDPAYFERGLSDGILPNIQRFTNHGFSTVAQGVMPSYTNPNNMSIVTGAPQSVHGISGNYFFDPETGQEHMMNDPAFLRSETILEKFSSAGAKVIAITAKDKLRRLLGRGFDFENGCINFSSEKSDECTIEENGIENVLDMVGLPPPDVYSADLSTFVLEAGIKILQGGQVDLMYLSLTDYIQHKYAPGTPEINDLYTRLDDAFGRLADAGAVVAITADHGMSDKSLPDGSPNVIYLKDHLDEKFGEGETRVILPITDPYVRHHGALGGFARVYCGENTLADEVAEFVKGLTGIEAVYDNETACHEFDLPPDREGDVVVISNANTAIGSSEAEHDLSALQGYRLRSHGGLAERHVPMIVSEPLNKEYAHRSQTGTIKSYEIFEYAINGT